MLAKVGAYFLYNPLVLVHLCGCTIAPLGYHLPVPSGLILQKLAKTPSIHSNRINLISLALSYELITKYTFFIMCKST